MKKTKKIIFSIFALIFIGFLYSKNFPDDFRYKADKIALKTAKKLSKKYNMKLVGYGGSMMHDIKAINLDFSLNRTIQKKEARKIIIKSLESFCKSFNKNKEIHAFLHNFPFTENNIQIGLFNLVDKTSTAIIYLEWVDNFNNRINYHFLNTSNDSRFCEIEPYEEALKIVVSQRTNPNS